MLALAIPYLEIEPATWQHKMGIWRWQKLGLLSPLQLARKMCPNAPLKALADDGKAVAMLLADLARQDHPNGYNRFEAQAVAQMKVKRSKQRKRAARKAEKAQRPLVQQEVFW